MLEDLNNLFLEMYYIILEFITWWTWYSQIETHNMNHFQFLTL